jgi:hypothetical protein
MIDSGKELFVSRDAINPINEQLFPAPFLIGLVSVVIRKQKMNF